jgi:phosphate transport system permease protein
MSTQLPNIASVQTSVPVPPAPGTGPVPPAPNLQRPPIDFNSRGMRLNDWFRYTTNHFVTVLSVGATAIVIVPLVAILGYLIYMGASSLNWDFFTKIPASVGMPGGGMANSIVGSGVVLGLASLLGIPVGIAAGVYLAEFGQGKMMGNAVRFTADVLNGVPSIVMGIAVYSLIVMQQKHFSAFAGGVALAIMMVPTITRTTEEMLATVPGAVREAALGLGVPKWRTTVSVSLATAAPGIITGCMLAFARVAGETAPLLFTAFGNQFWSLRLNEPIGALPLQIYLYAVSPYDEWHRLAWAGSLVLIVLIMVAVTLVRVYSSRGALKGGN